jgi:hypothetical protein
MGATLILAGRTGLLHRDSAFRLGRLVCTDTCRWTGGKHHDSHILVLIDAQAVSVGLAGHTAPSIVYIGVHH